MKFGTRLAIEQRIILTAPAKGLGSDAKLIELSCSGLTILICMVPQGERHRPYESVKQMNVVLHRC